MQPAARMRQSRAPQRWRRSRERQRSHWCQPSARSEVRPSHRCTCRVRRHSHPRTASVETGTDPRAKSARTRHPATQGEPLGGAQSPPDRLPAHGTRPSAGCTCAVGPSRRDARCVLVLPYSSRRRGALRSLRHGALPYRSTARRVRATQVSAMDIGRRTCVGRLVVPLRAPAGGQRQASHMAVLRQSRVGVVASARPVNGRELEYGNCGSHEGSHVHLSHPWSLVLEPRRAYRLPRRWVRCSLDGCARGAQCGQRCTATP